MLIWIEVAVVLIALAIAFLCPDLGSIWFGKAEKSFPKLARRQGLAVIVVGLLALCARITVLPLLPIPQPSVNDEFSHLLLADTLAHGRLTNPTHPMWIHFETFHVIMKPTYASMYPPAQGMALALGQALAGRPFIGVWLSVGLMCAAICWMLQAWLPPEWALLGGLFAVMRLAMFSYWGDSYWGGAVAATGGALLLGALPRVMRFERYRDVFLMGVGLAILANSRPYEGLVLSLPVAFAILTWIFGNPVAFWGRVRHVVVPLTLVVFLGAVATGYYCWRVTGNPFRMPQQVDRQTYGVAPYFIGQHPKLQPVYNHEEMRDFYLHNELGFYQQTRQTEPLVALWIVRFAHIWIFYFGPIFTFPIIFAMATSPRGINWLGLQKHTRFLLLSATASILGLMAEVFFFPHYAAPMTCVIFALVLVAMREMRKWQWRGKPVGLFLMRTIPITCLLMVVLRVGATPLHLPLTPDWPPSWYNSTPVETGRARLLKELLRLPGEHLVIVHYNSPSKLKYDWVYNDADIDNAKVVWARDMGRPANKILTDYFSGRRVWLVEPEDGFGESAKLSPYPPFSGSGGE